MQYSLLNSVDVDYMNYILTYISRQGRPTMLCISPSIAIKSKQARTPKAL